MVLHRVLFLTVTSFIVFSLLTPAKLFISVNRAHAQTSSGTVTPIEKYLTVETALLGVSDNVSLYFKDLTGGGQFSIEPSRSWIPASTIKAYVVLEAFRQKRLGFIDFNSQVTIRPENVVSTELETDEFPELKEGVTVTIKQLVETMIIQSDNTAYNTLLDVLDRRNINSTLRSLGLTETVVGEKLNLDDDQFQKDLAVSGRQPNTTTAKDYLTLFDLIYRKQIADSDEIISIFKRQKINNMIPAFLPKNVSVAHKSGDLAPIYHDGGIIYKPEGPFILAVFTNSNNPSDVASIAKVAYFQNADSVGQPLSSVPLRPTVTDRITQKTSLARGANAVLGVQTKDKFPSVTAADLGITQEDLNPQKAKARKVGQSFVNPGSLLYPIKTFFESLSLRAAKDNNSKVSAQVGIAESRVSEMKSAVKKGDLGLAATLLNKSDEELARTVALAQDYQVKDENLLKIRQANDVQYAALSDVARDIPSTKKEEFVDMVYNFYLKNNQDVKPFIKKSIIKSSVEQQPVIGTVTGISGDKATVRFDDNSIKEVVINNNVPQKQFGSQKIDQQNKVKEGARIAIVGQTSKDEKLIPTFILRNVPKEFPDRKVGVVTSVDPENQKLEIKDQQGQDHEIKIENDTQLKSRDTSVSVEGIKPGSQVTVFGAPKPTAPLLPQTTTSATIKANTVTVNQNSSGKEEKKEEKKKPEEKKKEPEKKSEPSKKEEKKH